MVINFQSEYTNVYNNLNSKKNITEVKKETFTPSIKVSGTNLTEFKSLQCLVGSCVMFKNIK